MKKLVNMTDFILIESQNMKSSYEDSFILCENYAKFLKQELKLWMFTPADEENNIIENPSGEDSESLQYSAKINEYNESKEAVLFNNYHFNPQDVLDNLNTIEDLSNIYEPELTENALKQIWKQLN